MTIENLKKHCEKMQENKSKPFKENCSKCEHWKATSGCKFYSRPIDWKV